MLSPRHAFLFCTCIAPLFNLGASSNYTHNKPIPSIPNNFDPVTTPDVFGLSVITQIHEPLFKLDKHNLPIKNLVESFEVSENQKTYSLRLGNFYFHDGRQLTAKDVKESLTRAIKLAGPGTLKLADIKGVSTFLKKKESSIKGIKIFASDPKKLEIDLIKPCPTLPFVLSEPRLAIINVANPKTGLGPYKILNSNENSIILQKFSDKNPSAPSTIIFKKTDKNAAIAGFNKGEFQDLFSFTIDDADLASLSPKTFVAQTIYSPKTYLFAINAKTITSTLQRESILAKIDRKILSEKCYKQSTLSWNVIPPGLFGHNDNLNFSIEAPHTKPPSRLRIGIAKGVGSEECVSKLTNQYLSKATNLTIETLDTANLVRRWQKGSLDLIFIYLESGLNLDLFQFFLNNSSFSMGPKDDSQYKNLISEILNEPNIEKKRKLAEKQSERVMKDYLVYPLFHPHELLIYSSRYKQTPLGVRTATHFEYKDLETYD